MARESAHAAHAACASSNSASTETSWAGVSSVALLQHSCGATMQICPTRGVTVTMTVTAGVLVGIVSDGA